jgi:hypothetical protein
MLHRLAIALCCIAAALFLGWMSAHAATLDVPCPAGAKSCKVLVLTPNEIEALTGKNMVLQTADQARHLDLGQIVQYFFTRLSAAPDGKPEASAKLPEKKVLPAPVKP